MPASFRRWLAAVPLALTLAGCLAHDDSDNRNYCASTAVDVNTSCQTAVDCPGVGKPNTNVGCENAHCTFSCRGEAYDVNGNTADGCEVVDGVWDNHYESRAIDLGDDSCLDSSSREEFSGLIASDVREHEGPRVGGFDGKVGGAPDWYYIRANGGQCENDLDFLLRVHDAAYPDRYHLTVITNEDSYDCTTNSNGECRVKDGSGSYKDESDIYIRVSKVNGGDTLSCAPDYAAYTVTGHL